MQIIMLETRRGCEDGFTIRRYEEGMEYDMADSEARRFIANGWATEVDAEEPINIFQEYLAYGKGDSFDEWNRKRRQTARPTNPRTFADCGEGI